MALDESDEQLAHELMGMLSQTGYKVALGNQEANEGEGTSGSSEPEAFDDFFSALNAFRAARASGDKEAEAAAENHLRDVVRGELTGKVD